MTAIQIAALHLAVVVDAWERDPKAHQAQLAEAIREYRKACGS